MANPGIAAIAETNANTNAGTASLRSLITTPSEDLASLALPFVAKLPLLRRTFSLPWPTDREARPVTALVAQLELERDGGDDIDGLAVHPHRLAAPLLYSPHRGVGQYRVSFEQLHHFDFSVLRHTDLQPHRAFNSGLASDLGVGRLGVPLDPLPEIVSVHPYASDEA